MPFISYNTSTGKLIELSDTLMFDGSPPSGMAITFINIPISILETDYLWNEESRDYEPIT